MKSGHSTTSCILNNNSLKMRFGFLVIGIQAYLLCSLFTESRAAVKGNSEFEECETADDCDGKCGSYFHSCGQGGICYCTDSKKRYDGAKVDWKKQGCAKSGGSDPCGKACKGRNAVVTKSGDGYICEVSGSERCYCEFKILDNLAGCKKSGDCNPAVCGGTQNCKTGKSPVGTPLPDVCDCTEDYKPKDCKDDSYCFGVCQSASIAEGKACPAKAKGKKTCVCDAT